tara:strand:- start:353 stop:850 length:498 start_codon:yes stop_codon:yes gene_type:complete
VAFSGGNISERRLEEITQPSDTPTSLLIKRFEDFSPVAKFDVKQNSNGFGTKARNAGEEISIEEAQERMMQVVNANTQRIEEFDEKYNYNFTEGQKAALNSFMYNLGSGSLDEVTGRDYGGVGSRSKEEIAEKMLEYVMAGGRRSPGLVRRRQEEHSLFTGVQTL